MSKRKEPSGAKPLRGWPGQRGKALRFVLLQHFPETRAPHFDLLLELHPRRKLWDLETPDNPTMKHTGITWKTHGLHRRRYLHFEGDVGQGRGVVKLIESGRYIVWRNGSVLRFQITGEVWKRTFEILRKNRGQHVWVHQSLMVGHLTPNQPGVQATAPRRARRARTARRS
jgi:hypothetical protein